VCVVSRNGFALILKNNVVRVATAVPSQAVGFVEAMSRPGGNRTRNFFLQKGV
jgi:hypothetical protein